MATLSLSPTARHIILLEFLPSEQESDAYTDCLEAMRRETLYEYDGHYYRVLNAEAAHRSIVFELQA